MVMSKVVPTTQELIDQLKGNLREADELECQASEGITADEAMQHAYKESSLSWIGLLNEKPFVIFGVVSRTTKIGYNNYSMHGTPWLLATEDIATYNILVARQSKYYVRKMLDNHALLTNFVDARNIISQRWLIWCGFNIAPAKPFGVSRLPFHEFWMWNYNRKNNTKSDNLFIVPRSKKQCVQSQQLH